MSDDIFLVVDPWETIQDAIREYSGSTFIRELVQNADDSRRDNKDKVKIIFDFYDDKLVVENNMKFIGDWKNLGTNMRTLAQALYEKSIAVSNSIREQFKDDDWIRINVVRSGMKGLCEKLTKGKFGIGFRSVYHLCDNPIIESDYKRIEFDGLKPIQKKSVVENTKFTFVYRNSETDIGKRLEKSPVTKEQKEKWFEDALNVVEFILFLDNTHIVEIKKEGRPIKTIERFYDKNKLVIKEYLSDSLVPTECKYSLLNDPQSPIQIMFCHDGKFNNNKRLYANFPLKYQIDIPFCVNAPFNVTESRDYLDENKQVNNNQILSKIVDSLVENIDKIKDIFAEPYQFYEFLIFRNELPKELAPLKELIKQKLKGKNINIVHTKLGWHNFENSYFIEPQLLRRNHDLVSVFETIEGQNYFDCINWEEYYDFLATLYQIKIIGKDNLMKCLSEIPSGYKITDTTIRKLENIIQVYKYLTVLITSSSDFTKREKINDVRSLPIFLDADLTFTNYSSIYYNQSNLSEVSKLLNIKTSFFSQQYRDELTNFYKTIGVTELSTRIIAEKLEQIDVADGVPIDKAIPPLNEQKNLILLLRTLSNESTQRKLPLILDINKRIYRTNSDDIFVVRNNVKLAGFVAKWGIPILHKEFIDFSYAVKNFDIMLFLKKLDTINEKMTRADLFEVYDVLNSYKDEIRNDPSKIGLLFGVPIFCTTGGKRVSLRNENTFLCDFKGYNPKNDIFIDESMFASEQLEGFKEFLLRIGVKKFNYNEFVKKYLEEIYVNATSEEKMLMLKELLVHRSELKLDTMDSLSKVPLFYCSDRQYHATNENIFFCIEDLIEIFGRQLLYVDIPLEFVNEHERELEILGILKKPTGKIISHTIVNLTNEKDADRLLQVIGYFMDNFDSFTKEDIISVSELACIPDHNLNLKKGHQIFSSNLIQQLDQLPNISYLHKDFGTPKREINEFFCINSLVPTELIIENLHISVKNKVKKSYLEFYRNLDNRVKDSRIELERLFDFPSIAVPILDNTGKLADVHFYKPARIFRESTNLDKIGSKYVEVLPKEYGQYPKIFEFLHIKTVIDIGTMMQVIEEIKTRSKLEEADSKVIQNIYRIISGLIKNKDNRISQLSEYTDKEIVLMKNQFRKPSEVFLNDNSEVTELFDNTNIEHLILTNDPDLLHFYTEVGVSCISQVRKFDICEFINQEISQPFTEKVRLVYSSRDEIMALTRRDSTGDKEYLESIERKIEILKEVEILVADDIVVDVTIPGIVIRPAINKRSVKSLIHKDKIYLCSKMSKDAQIQRLSKEISYCIFGKETPSFFIKAIINCKDKSQVTKLFSETVKVVIDDTKGHTHEEDIVPIKTSTRVSSEEDETEPVSPKTQIQAGDVDTASEEDRSECFLPKTQIETEDVNAYQEEGKYKGTEQPQKGLITPTDVEKRQYYLTKEWKKLQQKCIDNARDECEKCGSDEDLMAHHLTYERFGNEKLEDLQCLCRNCHETIHGKLFDDAFKRPDQGIKKVVKEEKNEGKNLQDYHRKEDNGEKTIMAQWEEKNENYIENIKKIIGSHVQNQNKSTQEKYDLQEKKRKNNIRAPKTHGIFEPLDTVPLSLEEENELKIKIEALQKQGIEQGGIDIIPRYAKFVKEVDFILRKKPGYVRFGINSSQYQATRLELYGWYKGKCQICGKTFPQKNGGNYFVLFSIVEFQIGGNPVPGNALCLCPDHWAKMKYGRDTDQFKPDKIKENNLTSYGTKFDNTLTISMLGKTVNILFKREHVLFIEDYWRPSSKRSG